MSDSRIVWAIGSENYSGKLNYRRGRATLRTYQFIYELSIIIVDIYVRPVHKSDYSCMELMIYSLIDMLGWN